MDIKGAAAQRAMHERPAPQSHTNMEGDVMKQGWFTLTMLALALLPSGCSKYSPTTKPPESRAKTEPAQRVDRADQRDRYSSDRNYASDGQYSSDRYYEASRDDRYAEDRERDDRYAERARVTRRTARDTKRGLDEMADDAEEFLGRKRDEGARKIRSQAQRAAELATQALEDAKDRAEDVPADADQLLERRARRLRKGINHLEDVVEELRGDVKDVEKMEEDEDR